MESSGENVPRTVLTGSTIVELAEHSYREGKRPAKTSFYHEQREIGPVILLGIGLTAVSVFISESSSQTALKVMGQVVLYCLLVAAACYVLFVWWPGPLGRCFRLIKKNVPAGRYTVKRVQLLRVNDTVRHRWYYVADGQKEALEKSRFRRRLERFSIQPQFLNSAEVFRAVEEYGTDVSPSPTGDRHILSNAYYDLVFVRDKPCIIIPETQLTPDGDVTATD